MFDNAGKRWMTVKLIAKGTVIISRDILNNDIQQATLNTEPSFSVVANGQNWLAQDCRSEVIWMNNFKKPLTFYDFSQETILIINIVVHEILKSFVNV